MRVAGTGDVGLVESVELDEMFSRESTELRCWMLSAMVVTWSILSFASASRCQLRPIINRMMGVSVVPVAELESLPSLIP